jgi:hypothetical protein
VSRVATVSQMRNLAILADPRTVILAAPRHAPWPALRAHGWIEPVDDPGSACIERITPEGLRALADALERHGYEALLNTGRQA